MADSLFPPSIWAEFSNSTMRTTKVCESFHSKLNSMFYSPSPNIFQLVDVLKQVQCDIYVTMRSSNLSNRRREILEKEKSISLVMTKIKNIILLPTIIIIIVFLIYYYYNSFI